MELLEHTKLWVNGEVFQGKIMMGIGIVVLLAWIAIFRSEHTILNGTLIPMALMLVVFLGYGGMQVIVRPNHTAKLQEITTQKGVEEALKHETEYLKRGDKAYSTLKPIWAALIILSVVLYFVVKTDYLKGLSIGLMALFLTLVVLDTTLQYRLSKYLSSLQSLL